MAAATTATPLGPDSRSTNEIDDLDIVKPEHATHIEGALKDEERDGLVAISDAENKRLRRRIHAR